MHIDATWKERNAVRADFGKLIGRFESYFVFLISDTFVCAFLFLQLPRILLYVAKASYHNITDSCFVSVSMFYFLTLIHNYLSSFLFPCTGELKTSLQVVLARGPRSLEDFRHTAAAEGMHVLI